MTLADHADSYIEFRRSTGLSFQHAVPLLGSFAAYAEAEGDTLVRAETCIAWASQAGSSRQKRTRLQLVRGNYHRPPPRLLSAAQIRLVMDAASQLPPGDSITPVTFRHIIGLLASTGMRRSEAIGLALKDVTPDGLQIRNAKFGRARLVPLHASVRSALERYLDVRLRCSSRPVSPDYLTATFIRLARQVGLRGGPGELGPRLHDLRHSFATGALQSVASGDRSELGRHVLALSTYLGHAHPANTYWYLEATPVLLNQVSAATERLHARRRRDV